MRSDLEQTNSKGNRMTTLLIVIVVILVLGGGGWGFYRWRQ
jgi:LPXTG-motif cell wall-anchored protein